MSPKLHNVLVWILTFALSVAFLTSGMEKLVGNSFDLDDCQSVGYNWSVLYTIGAIEFLTSLGLWVKQYRIWAATIQAILMVGAIGLHMMANDLHIIGGPLFLGGMAAALVYLLSMHNSKEDEVEA